MSLAVYAQTLGARIQPLATPQAQGMLGAWGGALDTALDLVHGALRASRLEDAPGGDVLDAHARNRAFLRVRGESDATLRQWLRGTFPTYKKMGTLAGLQANLARLGCMTVRATSALDLYFAGINAFGLSPGFTGPIGGYPGFFYVEIDWANPFRATVDWDGAADWDGSALWDLAEPYAGALGDVREVIWRWKPFGRSCRFARIRVGSTWLTLPVGERWEWSEGSVSGPYLQDFMVI